jgi:hypothetical protein
MPAADKPPEEDISRDPQVTHGTSRGNTLNKDGSVLDKQMLTAVKCQKCPKVVNHSQNGNVNADNRRL